MESPVYVIDSNVWYVAQAGVDVDTVCHIRSLEFLSHMDESGGRIAVDYDNLILEESTSEYSVSSNLHSLVPLNSSALSWHKVGFSTRESRWPNDVALIPNGLEHVVHDRDDRNSLRFLFPYLRHHLS